MVKLVVALPVQGLGQVIFKVPKFAITGGVAVTFVTPVYFAVNSPADTVTELVEYVTGTANAKEDRATNNASSNVIFSLVMTDLLGCGTVARFTTALLAPHNVIRTPNANRRCKDTPITACLSFTCGLATE